MTCKLLNQDCIQFLKQLPDESVDLVVTDPPYFIGYDGGKGWDSQWETEEDYLDWCKEWTSECARVLKPGKCLYVWGTTKTDTFLKYKLDVLNSLEDMVYQNWIIWAYDWGGRTKKKFPRKHEDLLMYSKGKEFDFFADSVKVERAVKSNMNLIRKMNLINKFIDGLRPYLSHRILSLSNAPINSTYFISVSGKNELIPEENRTTLFGKKDIHSCYGR